MNTKNNEKKLIAVIGATGQQGGGVVRALQTSGQFNLRALSRDPNKHSELAADIIEAVPRCVIKRVPDPESDAVGVFPQFAPKVADCVP